MNVPLDRAYEQGPNRRHVPEWMGDLINNGTRWKSGCFRAMNRQIHRFRGNLNVFPLRDSLEYFFGNKCTRASALSRIDYVAQRKL
jgi:hypothetical protein